MAKTGISLYDCSRWQGFDNGENMVRVYKGVETHIGEINSYALFSNFATHCFNVCGGNAAETCEDTAMFFGVLEQLYMFFSVSTNVGNTSKKK